jgi:hypothetical protein
MAAIRRCPKSVDDLDLLSLCNISPDEQPGVAAKAYLVDLSVYSNAEHGFGGPWGRHRTIPTV